MQQLPVKFRLLQIISQQKNISNEELYQILKREYPNDRHVTPQGVDHYLMSLRAVGLIKETSAELSNSGSILQKYQITSKALHKMKYLD